MNALRTSWHRLRNSLKTARLSTIVLVLLIAFVILFAMSLIAVYVLPKPIGFVERLKNTLPYPVATVGYRHIITTSTLAENMASVRRFYETQDFSKAGLRVDFSTEEGQMRFKIREKEVLNKMIEDEAIKLLALRRNIRVSRDEARQAVLRKLEENGSAQVVKNDLERLYGWSLEDFQEKVVIPNLYKQKLETQFLTEVDTTTKGRQKISEAQAALRSGTPFAEVAQQYSEGATAASGGEMGWFALPDLALELRQPVSTQKIGVPGDVIESSLGFHVILVEETKQDGEATLYRLRQIFTRKVTFADWLSLTMQTLPITVLTPEYRWNALDTRVEFNDASLRASEKDLFEKGSGDPAFFF